MKILIAHEKDEFIHKASSHLISRIIELQKDAHKIVKIGLSGGSTPGPIYSLVASSSSEIDWKRVLLFLVDERYVPADHKDSNHKLIMDTWIQKIPFSKNQQHSLAKMMVMPETALPLDACVKKYGEDLEKWVDSQVDIMVMGMGPDGKCVFVLFYCC